jgi:hypothetical protein
VVEELDDVEAQAWPAGQAVHTDCPPIEYVPDAHAVDALDVIDTHT